MTKDDRYLEGLIEDKIERCRSRYSPEYTTFLDAHQQSVARKLVSRTAAGDVTFCFYGGYDDADRVIFMALPDYITAEEAAPFALISRDYLGSLTGLGIKRELTGDILVRDDGADIIVMEEIGEFIMTNYAKAGRTALLLARAPLSELMIPEKKVTVVRDTLASLRLDNVVASAFGLSRTKAAEAVKRGIVFVDSIEAVKPDMQVEEGSKVVLRGSGKVYLKEIGGKSRKDRIYVTFEKY